VAVVGDIHGNYRWMDIVARSMRTLAPGVTTVLQLGDWWMDPDTTDEALDGTGIERIYVTLGNHEPWDQITPLLDAHPDCAIRVSEITWILPRPARLTIGGRSVLSLGGAVSVDRAWRQEGVSWWKDEEVTSDSDIELIDSNGDITVSFLTQARLFTADAPLDVLSRPIHQVLYPCSQQCCN
jgi:hypothetical protein